jgi:hypothetical protein
MCTGGLQVKAAMQTHHRRKAQSWGFSSALAISRRPGYTEQMNPEQFAEEFLAKRLGPLGLTVRKLPESNVKTPDFEVLDNGERVAVVELKSPQSVHFEGMGDDNGAGRISTLCYSASRQLEAYSCTRVLFIVNYDDFLDLQDLDTAFGRLPVYPGEVGFVDLPLLKIAQGRFAKRKHIIDVCLWLDRWESEPRFRFWGQTGRETAERLFGYASPPPRAA